MKLVLSLVMVLFCVHSYGDTCPDEVIDEQVVNYLSQEINVDYDVALKSWILNTVLFVEGNIESYESVVETEDGEYLVKMDVDYMCDGYNHEHSLLASASHITSED